MWCHHYLDLLMEPKRCANRQSLPRRARSSPMICPTRSFCHILYICDFFQILCCVRRKEQIGGTSKNKRKPNMHNFNCAKTVNLGRPSTRRQRWRRRRRRRRRLTDTLSFCRRRHSILINQYHLQFVRERMGHCVGSNVTDCIVATSAVARPMHTRPAAN